MSGLPWILFAVAGLIVILAVSVIWYYRRHPEEKLETDYYAFFIMGIAFIPVGIAVDNPGLGGMGIIFAILGLTHRDKWKTRERWSTMSPARKRLKMFILIGLTVLLVLGVLAFFVSGR